jgi:hypothetical protein
MSLIIGLSRGIYFMSMPPHIMALMGQIAATLYAQWFAGQAVGEEQHNCC